MTTYNTRNPIGSKDPRDLYDNAENLDIAVNDTSRDTWRDRMGRSRLTWEAIAKAGTGDTGVAIDAANRAVGAAGQAENEANRAAGAASRAENAEAVVDATNIKSYVVEAGAARDAAFVNADVYPTVAEGRAAVADGEQFIVVSSDGKKLERYKRQSAGFSPKVASIYTDVGVDDLEYEYKAELVSHNLVLNKENGNRKISFGNSYVYHEKGRFLLSAQEIDFGSLPGSLFYVLLNKSTLEVEPYLSSEYVAKLNARTHYLLFITHLGRNAIYGFSGSYRVIGDQTGDGEFSALTNYDNFNFNFIENKIEVTSTIWVSLGSRRLNIPVQEVALDPERNTTTSLATIVTVNLTTGALGTIVQTANFSLPEGHATLCSFRERDQLVWGLKYYSINGVPAAENPRGRLSPLSWNRGVVANLSVSDSFTNADPLSLFDIDTAQVYEWYDDLMAENPEYITKTLLGKDASNTFDVFVYRFKPKLPSFASDVDKPQLPKVMIIAQHNEQINFVYPYLMLREVCESWQQDATLSGLRHGVEFIVIPVANPWGLDNNSRTNSNGVDINRNHPVGWMYFPAGVTHSGPNALSEPETQYINNVLSSERPDVFYDCHSYGGWNYDGASIWIPIINDLQKTAVTEACINTYGLFKKEHPWLEDLDKFARFTNDRIVGGGIASKTANAYGAVGGTLEIAWSLKGEPGGDVKGSALAIKFSADLMTNIVLRSLEVSASREF